jgi:hypothetical protein
MKNHRIILSVIFLLFCGLALHSQVTIGSGLAPRNAVLLDLKENDNPTGAENSSKGLGLPRVKLADRNTFIAGYTQAEIDNSVGVTVYNIDNTALDGEGIYTWNGKKWLSTRAVGGSPSTFQVKSINGYTGQMNKGKPLEWNRIRTTVTAEVSSPGAYQIITTKVNGVVYEASGIFEKAGTVSVDLIASGTPVNGGQYVYAIVQPSISQAVNFNSFVLASDGSGNTNAFSYQLVADNVTEKAGNPINITLQPGSVGTPPVNKTVKWYMDGNEYIPGFMGSVSVAADVMTILENAKISHSVYAVVYDDDNPGRYFITSAVYLNWTIPFEWGSADRVGDYDVYLNLIPKTTDISKEPRFIVSTNHCRTKYGPTARLSTIKEVNARLAEVTYADLPPKSEWGRTTYIWVISQSLLYEDLFKVDFSNGKTDIYFDAMSVARYLWGGGSTTETITSRYNTANDIALPSTRTSTIGVTGNLALGNYAYPLYGVNGSSWLVRITGNNDGNNATSQQAAQWFDPIIYGCSLPAE